MALLHVKDAKDFSRELYKIEGSIHVLRMEPVKLQKPKETDVNTVDSKSALSREWFCKVIIIIRFKML